MFNCQTNLKDFGVIERCLSVLQRLGRENLCEFSKWGKIFKYRFMMEEEKEAIFERFLSEQLKQAGQENLLRHNRKVLLRETARGVSPRHNLSKCHTFLGEWGFTPIQSRGATPPPQSGRMGYLPSPHWVGWVTSSWEGWG